MNILEAELRKYTSKQEISTEERINYLVAMLQEGAADDDNSEICESEIDQERLYG